MQIYLNKCKTMISFKTYVIERSKQLEGKLCGSVHLKGSTFL